MEDGERAAVLTAVGDLKSAVGELKGICSGTACRVASQGGDIKEALVRLGKLENRVTALEERIRHWRPIQLAASAATGLGGGGLVNAIISFFS